MVVDKNCDEKRQCGCGNYMLRCTGVDGHMGVAAYETLEQDGILHQFNRPCLPVTQPEEKPSRLCPCRTVWLEVVPLQGGRLGTKVFWDGRTDHAMSGCIEPAAHFRGAPADTEQRPPEQPLSLPPWRLGDKLDGMRAIAAELGYHVQLQSRRAAEEQERNLLRQQVASFRDKSRPTVNERRAEWLALIGMVVQREGMTTDAAMLWADAMVVAADKSCPNLDRANGDPNEDDARPVE